MSEEINQRHTSTSAEWYTPSDIIEASRAAMGGIDLDPASCYEANRTVQAASYFDEDANGFLRPWSKSELPTPVPNRIFLNPPGGFCDAQGVRVERRKNEKGYFYANGEKCKDSCQSSSRAWWFKLAMEFASGRVSQAIFLGFSIEILQTTQTQEARQGGAWTHANGEIVKYLPLDHHLCFPKTRVSFMQYDESTRSILPVKGNTHASVIVGLGMPYEKFEKAFESIGKCKV